MPALWKRSVGFVNGLLGDALGKIYVKHHFPPEYKQRMVELIDNLLESFRIGIEDLEWMSKETKEKAPQSVSGASRTGKSSGSKKVKLTPSQVAIAKKLGLTLEQYAKYV